jgi:superfamily II DNA or RNA helicase
MSIKTKLDDLPWETRHNISKDLKIKIEKKYDNSHHYLYPFEIIEDDIILPFAYASRLLKLKRPLRENFPTKHIVFNGNIRPEQKQLIKEATPILSRKGSVMISAYPGFGKCLGYGTNVMLSDGNVKPVQEIVIGDMLMGDDSTPRKVLNTCMGFEQMYKIIQHETGDTFTANESHMLSLRLTKNKMVNFINNKYITTYFDHTYFQYVHRSFFSKKDAYSWLVSASSPDIVDISIKKYLKLPNTIKNVLKSFKVGINFNYTNIPVDPYLLGQWLANKYKTIDNNQLSQDTIENIKSLGVFEKNRFIPMLYMKNSRKIRLNLLGGIINYNGCYQNGVFEIFEDEKLFAKDIIYLARSVGFSTYTNKENIIIIYGDYLSDIPSIYDVEKSKSPCNYRLYDFDIKEIYDTSNYYGFVIDGNHRFLLGDFTVTHNTFLSINIACNIGFKNLIIVNKLILMKQWEESIKLFCPNATIQMLTSKSNKEDCDFYIMNAQNIEKMSKTFFSDIGTVIVDEAHLIMAETLSRSMKYLQPRYLLGLSATPYRPDCLDILLDLYFGNDKIIRKLYRKHTIYKVMTNFKPTIELAKNGKVNWGIVLDSQANDVERNELIIKILKHFSDRNFLVLVKRISQGKHLVSRLLEEKEDVTSLLGNNQFFEASSRILIGTSQKTGVGFDHPKLDSLILAADIEEYFVQYLGRVFRTKNVEPIIFDLVDNYSILNKHFQTRSSVYREHGGEIKKFDISKIN